MQRARQSLHVLVGHERAHVDEFADGVAARRRARCTGCRIGGIAHDRDRAPRQPVPLDERLARLRDGRDLVGAVQQQALRPPGQVVQPPEQPDHRGQIARGRSVAVVDQVVKRQDEPVATPPRAHGLHRGEHDVRVQPVHLARDEQLAHARRRGDLHPGQIRQHLELPFVADQHRDGMPTGDRLGHPRGIAADSVVMAETRVAAVDDELHLIRPDRAARPGTPGSLLPPPGAPRSGSGAPPRGTRSGAHRGTSAPSHADPRRE